MNIKFMASIGLISLCSFTASAQVLDLRDALQRAVLNYDKIKSKQALVLAAQQNTVFQRQQFLPDLTLAAQQSFGTINVQHGPMYAGSGMASAATSMPLAEQNWNAAFGSLYFANINWDVFTFGRRKNQILLGDDKEITAVAAVDQEVFQQQVKVSAAYLNLLAAQRMEYVQHKNFQRAEVFFEMTDSRAKSGLIPEVDASLAKAEVSNAKSAELKAYDKVLDFSKQLAVHMGDTFQAYQLDSVYSTSVPENRADQSEKDIAKHPFLQLQQGQINESLQVETLFRSERMPKVSAFGVLQGRGSGFDANYAQDLSAYSSSYFKGVGVDRSNYLLGFSLSWNISNMYRFNTKIKQQKEYTRALSHDYDLLHKELNAQAMLAQAQIKNAYDNFEETKVQLSAALLAYKQHTALYENGLTTLVDYTQALYSLNRAEIDYELAQNNVWQGLLLLAAAQGDLAVLIKNPN